MLRGSAARALGFVEALSRNLDLMTSDPVSASEASEARVRLRRATLALTCVALALLAGCETINHDLSYLEARELQVNNKLPGGRPSFFVKDPRTISSLTRYFDHEVYWSPASGQAGSFGGRDPWLTIFYSNTPSGRYAATLHVHGDRTFKNGYVAYTDWERILEILEPHLFLPNEFARYEVWVAGEFWDPLSRVDLGLKEDRVKVTPQGVAHTTLSRLGGLMHELKRPIAKDRNGVAFTRDRAAFGVADRATARFVVDEWGRTQEVEILESTSAELSKACIDYLKTMRHEAGVFDGRYARFRVTLEIAFDEYGNLFDGEEAQFR